MTKRIRILATSDIHGCIYPYSYTDGMTAASGLSRMSTLINTLRDENTLLLDNGDSIEGSALTAFHYQRHPDAVNPVTAVMRELDYDYINVGNHDFNYGHEALMMHLQNIKAPCITSNFIWHGKPYGPTYAIREVAGKKIAVIAAVTQYLVRLEKKEHLKNMQFTDAFETVQKAVNLVKKWENPDYVIVLYHGGFERDPQTGMLLSDQNGENEAYKMLTLIPGIDVLITGHTHMSLCGKKNNTVYTQTAGGAKELACIDIYPDEHTISARLLTADAPADTAVTARIQEEENECQAWLDEVLGSTNVDLMIADEADARLHKSQTVTFINKVAMEAAGVSIAASPLYPEAGGFRKEITKRDLVNTYKYPNTLVVKRLTGKVLRAYLEKNAEYWAVKANGSVGPDNKYVFPYPKHHNYDMMDGVEYTITVSNPAGSRITSLTCNGAEVEDDQTYDVVFNSYRAGGAGGFDMIAKAPVVKKINSDMSDLIEEYIKKNKVIDFEPVNNITVEK